VAVLTEQDMLGDRLVRRRKRKKSQDAFLNELATLSPGRPGGPRRSRHRPL
jgi:transcription-repair coupling factor (superfamily II helicase)